jgi:hypothetical protein
MVALKARFDGKKIVMPKAVPVLPPGEVIVIFPDAAEAGESQDWMKAQESAFAKVWDNDEDAAYDDL